jgi:ligand-binding sensor domain-containing protein
LRLLSLISILTLTFYARAQEYSYKQYTTADGLPSNVVYSAFQDRDGYIWFCTNAGVSRFNGISFQNFTVEQGLSDNEVFGTFQVDPKRIWFRTFNNKLCYYENGVFHSYKKDPWLRPNFGGIRVTYIDDDGRAWARNYIDSSVYVLNERGRTIESFHCLFKDSIILVTSEGVDTVSRREVVMAQDKVIAFEAIYAAEVRKMTNVVDYFMLARKYLHTLKKQHPQVPLMYLYYALFNGRPVNSFKIHDLIRHAGNGQGPNSFWLTHANKGIALFSNLQDEDERPVTYLSDRNINNIMVDREGNYWFTSPTEGVFFLNAHGVRTVDPGKEGAEIYSVTGNDRYVICGKDKEVVFINKQTGRRFSWTFTQGQNSAVYNRIKDLLIDNNGYCWVASDIGAACISFSDKGAERRYPPLPVPAKDHFYVGAMKCLAMGVENNVYLGSHATLLTTGPGFGLHGIAFKRVTAVVEVGKNEVVFGSIDGLHVYNGDSASEYRNNHDSAFRQHITDLGKAKSGFICAATNDLGLIVIRNRHFYPIMAADSVGCLTSNICRKVFIDAADNIWTCTNKGLCKVSISSWEPFEYNVQQFTTDDGLISNDVNDVYVSNDTVWVATSGGLSYFRQKEVKQSGQVPKIYISRAEALNNHSFKYRSKIVIGLEGISYESIGKLRYRYRLKGLHDEWRYTDQNQLSYDVLPPGQYELEAYSINRFGQESAYPATVVFIVIAPWWRTNLAFALYLLAFIGLLAAAFLIIRRTSRLKERNRTKHIQQLQQLELKALRSQMNPHFIFNTLNAVQKYILENDKEASYRYLTRFSKLIRGFLENSRQTSISLKDELDLLRSYMEMEALRFQNKFTYEVEIDPTLDTAAVFIPSMLIQPYVENAIWHGIQHKSSHGYVKLSVRDQGGNVLLCRVQDNGIGRKRAEEIELAAGTQHQSVGMTITQQRLELINQRLKQAVSVNFIDIAEQQPSQGTGTIVELVIAYTTRKL